MTTPHRGLPPPAAMALPSPTQSSGSSLGQPPQAWQNSEEISRLWLQAKMEEDRRRGEEERTRQEQERTRQEQQRADTRKVELDLLREGLRGGIPPPLVPLIFMGAAQSKTQVGEWMSEHIAQYMAAMAQQQQMQHQAPPVHHMSHVPPPPPSPQQPSLRREHRQIQQLHQAGGPGPPVQQMGPPTAAPAATHPPPGYIPSYPMAAPGGPARPAPPVQQVQQSPQQPTPPLRSSLPRINTGEVQIHQTQPPPTMPPNMPLQIVPTSHAGPTQQSHHPPTASAQADNAPVSQSPSIFFHHWVPPNTQTGSASAQAQAIASPGPQRQLDSPFSSHPPPNQLTGAAEYTSPPKKRKANTGQAQPPPPGGSQVPFSPNSASATPARGRRGHSRHRSDTSNTGVRGFEQYNRPATRQRRSIGESSLHMSEGVPGEGQHMPATESRGGSQAPADQQQQQQQQQAQKQRESTAPPTHNQQTPHSVQRPYSAGPDWKPSYPAASQQQQQHQQQQQQQQQHQPHQPHQPEAEEGKGAPG